MKKILSLLLVLCTGLYNSQSIFFKSYTYPEAQMSGNNDTEVNSVFSTSDGGYMLAGNSLERSNRDFMLTKTDASGNPLWAKVYGSEGQQSNTKAIQTQSKKYVIIGGSNFTTGTLNRTIINIWRLNANGSSVWEKKIETSFSGNTLQIARDVAELPDGSLLVAGNSSSNTAAPFFKLDSLGNLLWAQNFSINASTSIHKIVPVSNGDILLAGTTGSIVFVSRHNSTGSIIWAKTYAALGFTTNTLQETSDGNFVFANGFGSAISMTKIDGMGNLIWSRKFTTPGSGAHSYALKELTNGDLIATGTYSNPNSSCYLLRTNAMGVLQNAKTFTSNTNNFDKGYNIESTLDGALAVCFQNGMVKFTNNLTTCSGSNLILLSTTNTPVASTVVPVFNTFYDANLSYPPASFTLNVKMWAVGKCGGKCNTADNLLSSSYADLNLVCKGTVVTLSNTSNGQTNALWHLNGVPFSTANSSTVLCNVPGTQTVQLVVGNAAGCRDTSTQIITVDGNCGNNGNVLKQMQYGMGGYCAIPTPEKGFVLGGGSGVGMSMTKIDSLGQVVWTQSFGRTSEGVQGFRMIRTHDKNYLLVGENSARKIMVLKADSLGNYIWHNYFEVVNSVTSTPSSIKEMAELPDGSVIICGDKTNTGWVMKISVNGGLIWEKHFSGPSTVYANSVVYTPINEIVVGGYYNSSSFFVFLDTAGNVLRTRLVGGKFLEKIINTNDGNLAYATTVNHFQHSINVAALFKTDLYGNSIWAKGYKGFGSNGLNSYGRNLTQTDDGRYIFLNSLELFPNGNRALMLIDENGNVLNTINETSSGAGGHSSLLKTSTPQTYMLCLSGSLSKFTVGSYLKAPCVNNVLIPSHSATGGGNFTVALNFSSYAQELPFSILNNTFVATPFPCVNNNSCNVSSSFVAPIVTCTNAAISCTNQSIGGQTYAWRQGSVTIATTSNAVVTYTSAGTYTLKLVAFGSGGCSDSTTKVITVNNNTLIANAGTDATLSCGNSYTLAGSGGLFYNWSPATGLSNAAISNPVASPTINTTYTLRVSNNSGCYSDATVSLTVNGVVPTLSVSGGNTLCNGSSLTLTANGASTYTWLPISSLNNSVSASPVASPTITTNYTLIGSNGTCTNSTTHAITITNVPANITAISGATNICGNTIQQYSFAPINQSNSYNWTLPSGWSGTSTTNIITTTVGSTGGNILVEAQNDCGSSPTKTLAISVSGSTINAPGSILGNSVVCLGSNNTFSIAPLIGATSYSWSAPSGWIGSSTSNSITLLSNGSSGSITVYGYNTCSTSVVASVSLAIDNPSIAITSNTTQICNGNTVSLTASGVSTYSWSTGASSHSIVVTPTVNLTYTVTGFSANACSVIATKSIAVLQNPSVNILGSNTVCLGSSLTYTANGAVNYTWSSSSNANTISVTPTINTNYSLTGTDINGCQNTATIGVTTYSLPIISANSGTFCSGSAYTIVPSGASTYSINGGNFIVTPVSTSNYSISGTDSFGCVSSSSAIVSLTMIASPTVSVNSGAICLGQFFTLTPTGVSSFTISGNNTIVSPSANIVYTVVGTNSLGCVSNNTAIASITVNPLPVISVNNGSICSGESFTINPTGASTYTFSSGSHIVSPLSNSTYSVIGTNSLNCVASNSAVLSVDVYSLPIVSASSGSICSGSNFTIIPIGASSYSINGGSFVVSPTVTTNYTVNGMSAFGCNSSNTVVLTVSVVSSPSIGISNGSICAGQSFTLVPNGAQNYVYSSGSNVVSPLSNTTYSITGTNSLGCSSTNTALATVSVNPLPTVSVANGTLCVGQSYTINPSGASSYNYSSGSNVVAPSSNTFYTISGTSSLGCISATSATVTLNVSPLPTITVASGTVCSGLTYTLSPSGASNYVYSSGSHIVSPNTNTSYAISGTSSVGCASSNTAIATLTVISPPTISVTSGTVCSGSIFTIVASGASIYNYSGGSNLVAPTTTTNYAVTGISSEGCNSTNTAIATVTVIALPSISVTSGSICAGGTFTLIATGASSYNYSGGSNLVSPNTTTNYAITGTSSLGCSSSNTAIAHVSVMPLPTISVNSGSICAGSVFTITATGASSYSYEGGSTFVSPTTNTSYAVTGTSSLGCASSNTAIASVTVNALPTISINSGTLCFGSTFTLNPSGASTYSYSGGSQLVSPTTNTTYAVTGTSSLGCNSSNTAIASVTIVALPSVSVSNGSVCSGGIFSITATGASSYNYSGGSATVSPVINTTYTVTGLSAEGCISSNSAFCSVTVLALPSLSITGLSAVCSGDSSTLTVNGASTYLWSNNASTSSIIVVPLSTTVYTVLGTAVNGCQDSATKTVSVIPLPNVGASTNNTAICIGASVILNGSGALTYSWSGSVINGSPFNPTQSASYTVTGIDQNGCENKANITVMVNNLPVVTASASSNPICLGKSVTLYGVGANTYNWSGGINDATAFFPNTSGTYTVTGIDVNNCQNTASIFITVNLAPEIPVSSSNNLLCRGETATLTASGGNLYSWSNGDNTSYIVITPSTSTSYTVTGTDLNGCVKTVAFTQNVSECTGIDNQTVSEESGLELYPNPTFGAVYYSVGKEDSYQYYIQDLLGQQLESGNLKQQTGNFDLTKYAKGIYFITISSDKTKYTKKVILH